MYFIEHNLSSIYSFLASAKSKIKIEMVFHRHFFYSQQITIYCQSVFNHFLSKICSIDFKYQNPHNIDPRIYNTQNNKSRLTGYDVLFFVR